MTQRSSTSHDLIQDHQRLVWSLARKVAHHAPSHVDLDDLVSYGQVGLAEAARDFDPGRGGQFSTYAYYRIRGAMYDGLSKMSWTSRSRYNRLRYEQMANEALQSANESSGTDAGTATADANWLRGITEQLAVIYLATRSDEGGVRESSLADDNPSPSVVVAGRELQKKIHLYIEQLAEESQTLIRSVYLEGLTIQDAGKKLGLSKSWASRLHARALKQLSHMLRQAGIENSC